MLAASADANQREHGSDRQRRRSKAFAFLLLRVETKLRRNKSAYTKPTEPANGACSPMRPPPEAEIYAPEFPRGLEWLNVAFLRMNTLMGGGVALVEFWDFARINSLRTLPYLTEWHNRYREAGLRVIGVHTPGYSFGRDRDTVARAVERLEIPFAVALDPDYQVWREYGNKGWPGRYLFDRTGQVGASALRRGRVRGHRARDRRGARRRRRADGAAASRGRARRPARAADRRHRATRGPRPARAGARLDGRRGLDRGRRRRRGRPASASAAGAAYAVLSEGGLEEPGLYEMDGTVEAESPGLRLHGVQFTPAPPAPS